MNKIINRWILSILIIISIVSVSLNASECTICYNGVGLVKAHDSILATATPHMYHRDCIKKWASINPTCPECRHPIDINSLMIRLTKDQKARFWSSVCVNATLSGITFWATDSSLAEWVSDGIAENIVNPAVKIGLRALVASMPPSRIRTSVMTQRIINCLASQMAFWGTTYAILGKKGCHNKIDKLIFYSTIKGVRLISDFILRRGYDADLYEQDIDKNRWLGLEKKLIQAIPFCAGFFYLQSPAIEYIGIGKQHLMLRLKRTLS